MHIRRNSANAETPPSYGISTIAFVPLCTWIGVEERDVRLGGHGRRKGLNKKMMLYSGLALIPLFLFGLMLLLAKR